MEASEKIVPCCEIPTLRAPASQSSASLDVGCWVGILKSGRSSKQSSSSWRSRLMPTCGERSQGKPGSATSNRDHVPQEVILRENRFPPTQRDNVKVCVSHVLYVRLLINTSYARQRTLQMSIRKMLNVSGNVPKPFPW